MEDVDAHYYLSKAKLIFLTMSYLRPNMKPFAIKLGKFWTALI